MCQSAHRGNQRRTTETAKGPVSSDLDLGALLALVVLPAALLEAALDDDPVTSVHVVASELTAQGFGSQLLAAPFLFEGGEHPVYWIYGFKLGTFWPFIPLGDEKRDNAAELELKAKLEKELPIEQDLTRWLALFDAPI